MSYPIEWIDLLRTQLSQVDSEILLLTVNKRFDLFETFSNLLQNVPSEMAAKIFLGGAGLNSFKEEDFRKAAGTEIERQAVRAVG